MRQGNDEYNTVDFLAGLQSVRAKAFKPSTIKSSFQQAGLFPFNPQIVLDRLARNKAKTTETESEDEETVKLTEEEAWFIDSQLTPYTVREFHVAAAEIQLPCHSRHL
jgi:hypothetical protein